MAYRSTPTSSSTSASWRTRTTSVNSAGKTGRSEGGTAIRLQDPLTEPLLRACRPGRVHHSPVHHRGQGLSDHRHGFYRRPSPVGDGRRRDGPLPGRPRLRPARPAPRREEVERSAGPAGRRRPPNGRRRPDGASGFARLAPAARIPRAAFARSDSQADSWLHPGMRVKRWMLVALIGIALVTWAST